MTDSSAPDAAASGTPAAQLGPGASAGPARAPLDPDAGGPWFPAVSGIVLAAIALFTFLPIAKALFGGVLFGSDWSEYALTARQYLTHQSSQFTYPSPILPLVYVPITALTTNPVEIGVAAATISGLLLVMIYLAASRLFQSLTGTPWAGLLGGVMVTTAPLFLDEMGWGGQAQYLAILLGLLAFSWLLDKIVRQDRRWWAVPVAALLTIAALSEPYAAAYFLVAIAIYLVLAFQWTLVRLRNLLLTAGTLLPAIATIGILAIFNASTTATVSSQGATAVLGTLSVYPALYVRLAFYNPALELFYPVVVIAYVLTRRVRRYPEPRFRWLVPALALAWLPQFLLLTPWVDLDRALYFLMVPLGAMVAEISTALPSLWSELVPANSTPIPGPKGRLPARSYVVPVIALVAVLTVGAQVGVATHTYYGSLTFYSYPQGDLSELTFLQHENGSLLYISPSSDFFAAGLATGRTIYAGPPAQPALFTRPGQQAAVETATVLAEGASWLRAGNVWAIDGEPEWSNPAPGILELSRSYVLETLAIDDAFETVTLSPSGAPGVLETYTLASAPSIVHAVSSTALSTEYVWPDLEVTKTVTVTPDGAFSIAFQYAAPTAVIHAVNLTVIAPWQIPSAVEVPSPAGLGPVTLTQTVDSGIVPVQFTDTVQVAATGLAGNSTYHPPSPGLPANILSWLHPTLANATALSATVSISTGVAPTSPASVETEGATLSANDLNWVAVQKGSGQAYLERFLNDPEFSLYAQTAHYLVFETKWN